MQFEYHNDAFAVVLPKDIINIEVVEARLLYTITVTGNLLSIITKECVSLSAYTWVKLHVLLIVLIPDGFSSREGWQHSGRADGIVIWQKSTQLCEPRYHCWPRYYLFIYLFICTLYTAILSKH